MMVMMMKMIHPVEIWVLVLVVLVEARPPGMSLHNLIMPGPKDYKLARTCCVSPSAFWFRCARNSVPDRQTCECASRQHISHTDGLCA